MTASHTKPIDLVLGRLVSPYIFGPGWRARCPAHDGKSKSSLSIKELKDGRVLLHCFAGCDNHSVVHSLGLEMSDLFDRPVTRNPTPQERQRYRELAKIRKWETALETLPLELAVVCCAAVSLSNDKPLDVNDHKRLELAADRIKSAEAVLCGR